MKIIRGNRIELRPVTEDDRDILFRWAVSSDGTEWWYGEHLGDPIPTKEKFFEDFGKEYFDQSEANFGWYLIVHQEEDIGMLNFQPDEREGENGVIDFDILIANKSNYSQGFGNEALTTLLNHLKEKCQKNEFLIHVHPENHKAIRAYEKVGFVFDKVNKDEKGIEWKSMRLKK